MTPNEIYALDDLSEKPWYAFKKNKYILARLFPVLRKLSVDFNRAKADWNNRFSLCLKIRTPVRPKIDYMCWTLMFDGRPFGFFAASVFGEYSLDVNVFTDYPHVYITDLTLWQMAEDLVRSYIDVDIPISDKLPLSLPVLDSDQALVFERDFLMLAFVDGMALAAPGWHRTQDEIVVFNASIYHRLLNELIEREGEEKLNQMDWDDDSPIVEEMARIVLLSVPKGIEARAGSGMVKDSRGWQQRALAILRFDNGTYGLTIEKRACFSDYQNSNNIILERLGEPDMFGSAHERIKWMDEDPRRFGFGV